MAQWRRPVRPTFGVLVGRYLAQIYHMWSKWCHINVMSVRVEVRKVDLRDHVREIMVEILHIVLMIFCLTTIVRYITSGTKDLQNGLGRCFFSNNFLRSWNQSHLVSTWPKSAVPWVIHFDSYQCGYWPRSCYFTPETQTAGGPKLASGSPAIGRTRRLGDLIVEIEVGSEDCLKQEQVSETISSDILGLSIFFLWFPLSYSLIFHWVRLVDNSWTRWAHGPFFAVFNPQEVPTGRRYSYHR